MCFYTSISIIYERRKKKNFMSYTNLSVQSYFLGPKPNPVWSRLKRDVGQTVSNLGTGLKKECSEGLEGIKSVIDTLNKPIPTIIINGQKVPVSQMGLQASNKR
jgi:hypothetical protein